MTPYQTHTTPAACPPGYRLENIQSGYWEAGTELGGATGAIVTSFDCVLYLPEPAGGLLAGLCALAWLARRRG